MMPATIDSLERLLVALLVGLLIGLDRERAEVRKGRKLFAGIRTFPLISLLGAGLSLLRSEFGPLPLVAGLAGLPRSRSSRTARAFRTATSARRPRSRRWRRSCSARWLAQAS